MGKPKFDECMALRDGQKLEPVGFGGLGGQAGSRSDLKTSSAPRKLKPRRLMLKQHAPDEAAALFLMRASLRSEEVSLNMQAAIRLLKMRIRRNDVARLTGLKSQPIDVLVKQNNVPIATGRNVRNIGLIVHDAEQHQKASSFLVFLEQVIASDSNHTLNSQVFLAAIDAYEVLWHHDLVPTPYPLFLFLAQKLVDRQVYMTDCPRCSTRFLQLPFAERDPRNPLEGDCPHCRLLSSVMGCRPAVADGLPQMKPVPRIKRSISDHATTGRAYRMVVDSAW